AGRGGSNREGWRAVPQMGRGRSKKLKGLGISGAIDDTNTGTSNDNSANAANGILSPELMAELGVEHASEAVVDGSAAAAAGGGKSENLSARRKKRQRERSGRDDCETRQLAATLSKSKARKLKQLEDKKLKDGRRAELYRKLGSNKLAPGQLSLLQSSKSISQNQDTMKSRLTQSMQKAVAGMTLPDSAVREMESHPELVADIEERLALPVGGALAAVRRTVSRGQPKAAIDGDGGTRSKKMLDINRRGASVDGKKRAIGSGTIPAAAGGAAVTANTKLSNLRKSSPPRLAANSATTLATTVVSPQVGGGNSSRSVSGGSTRGGPSRPAPLEMVTVAVPQSNDNDGSSTSDSNTSDGEDESEDENAPSSSGVGVSTVEPVHAGDPGITVESKREEAGDGAEAEISKNSESSTAAAAVTAGASWAAKMMSSLNRVASDTANKTMGAAAKSGNNQKGDGDQKNVTSSYPPLPKWIDGKAPVHHAVETPLPCVSGKSAGATGGGGNLRRNSLPRPQRWIPVVRSVELQSARMQLPVCGMEQEITEAIHD
ncbi:unnamed protein product, partial [Sphacelaria rigidula]